MESENQELRISVGDNVRVRSTPDTEAKELAGLVGQVYGETTPSVTEVEVIGELTTNYAINVYFDKTKEDLWFTRELLELIDHGAGAEITLAGVSKKWTRSANGEWLEAPLIYEHKRPWWKFW